MSDNTLIYQDKSPESQTWAAVKELAGFMIEGIAFAAFGIMFCLFVVLI